MRAALLRLIGDSSSLCSPGNRGPGSRCTPEGIRSARQRSQWLGTMDGAADGPLKEATSFDPVDGLAGMAPHRNLPEVAVVHEDGASDKGLRSLSLGASSSCPSWCWNGSCRAKFSVIHAADPGGSMGKPATQTGRRLGPCLDSALDRQVQNGDNHQPAGIPPRICLQKFVNSIAACASGSWGRRILARSYAPNPPGLSRHAHRARSHPCRSDTDLPRPRELAAVMAIRCFMWYRVLRRYPPTQMRTWPPEP